MLLTILDEVQNCVFGALAQVYIHNDLLEGLWVGRGKVLICVWLVCMEIVAVDKGINDLWWKLPFCEFSCKDESLQLVDKDSLSLFTTIILE